MNPKTLAEAWTLLEHRLNNGVDAETLANMRYAFYLGASAYSNLLLQGHSARREVENFFALYPTDSG